MDVYDQCVRGNVDACVRDLLREARDTCLRRRLAILQHVDRAVATQARFHSVSETTRRLLCRDRRLAMLSRNMRLRRLQARLIRHLWHPRSRLVQRLARQWCA